MTVDNLRCRPVVLALFLIATWQCALDAEESSSTSAAPSTGASPANSNLQREYARLAQLLNSSDSRGQSEAADSLLKVRPSDVADLNTRKLVARGYRSLATEKNGFHKDKAVQGLVIWGGKYSVPILVEMLDKDKFGTDEIYDALGKLKDPQGAEVVARHLGNFFTHEKAFNSLRKMGPAAEDALIKAAPSNDGGVSVAAVQLLGEVGGKKSIDVLQRATEARNPNVKLAARESLKKVRLRLKRGEPAEKASVADDPNSPFAEGGGPPVDITARNQSKDFVMKESRNLSGVHDSPLKEGTTDEPADLDEGDWSQVHALLPGDPAGAGVPADPDKSLPTDWKPQPVRLGNKTNVHEQVGSISVSGGKSPIAVVIHTDPFNANMARMESVNLRRRQSVGSSNVVGGVKTCYLSPSGSRVLFVAQEGFHNRKARLDVWAMNGGKPTEQATWWPFATSKSPWGANEIKWADWVDDDQLMTVNGEGTTVLWRLDGKTPRAIYQIDANGQCTPALSPGHAYMALATPRGVEIFRASDGELLARMEDVRPGAGAVAFNADGTRLACVSGKSVYIWNATTGKLERDFDCADLRWGDLSWLDNDHLLVGGTDVVDLQRRIILWRYEVPHMPADTVGPWRWMVMENNNILGLVPAKLLQEEVLAAARDLDPDKILALKPGAKVSLDIQIGGEEQMKAEVAIRAALEQNGVQVAPDQPLKIAARIVTGKSETKEYRTGFGFRENSEQVTVTERRYEVELFVDGQSAWKQAYSLQSSSPPVIWMKKGESAQQTVDRENAERAKGFGFNVSIPRYVVNPKYAGPLGTSKVSLNGGR
jgi:hypothetical protein